MLRDEVIHIVKQYQHKQINQELFLEKLMLTGGQPRNINKYLLPNQRPTFTTHYKNCMWLAETLSRGLFC